MSDVSMYDDLKSYYGIYSQEELFEKLDRDSETIRVLLSALKVVLESWRETNDAGPIHSGYQSDWMIEQIRLADEAIAKAERE